MLKLQYSRRGLMRVIAVFPRAWLFGTKASDGGKELVSMVFVSGSQTPETTVNMVV